MTRRLTIRLSFMAAVALIAAAIGDPCVEIVANAGFFGSGYVDNNQFGAVPAIVAAAMFVIGIIILRALDSWQGRGRGNVARRLLGASRDAGGSPFAQIARIVPLQLAIVYGMECLEALMVHRAPPGGITWLGGPPAFSLAVQVVVTAGCLSAMRGIIRWLSAGLLTVIRVAVEIVVLLAAKQVAPLACAIRREAPSLIRAQAPHVRQIGGRAPPAFLLAPTL